MNKFLVIFVFFLTLGCGYTTRGSMYAGQKLIVVPAVNKIDVTSIREETSGYVNFPILIENKLTNEIVSKFNADGQLKVVSEDSQALRLSCQVNNYTKETLRYDEDQDGEVREQRLRLQVHIKLVAADGKVLIEKDITGEASYFLTGASSKSESSAQTDLVDDTARRISEAVLEEW